MAYTKAELKHDLAAMGLTGNRFIKRSRAACRLPGFAFLTFIQQKRMRYSRGVQCLISRKVLIK